MVEIKLTTEIHAPIEKCFEVARDIEIHQKSTHKTNERAIAGRTSGLCKLHDKITWEARHFSVRQRLQVQITKLEQPFFFEDVMLKGAFKSMIHQHYFERRDDITIMKDEFRYEVPFGFLGKIFDELILKTLHEKFSS